ncbi:MAG: hypothetical protein ACLQG3_01585 [Terracidiphilus sp.]
MSAATILALVLGFACTASANDNKKPAPPPPPKPAAQAPRPATPAARPAGNSGGGTMSRPGTSGPSANRPTTSGPSANRPTTSGPSANHPATTSPSANRPGPATGPSANRPGNIQQRPAGAFGNSPHPSAFRTNPPRGTIERNAPNGSVVRTRPNGRISEFHDPHRGIDVHHGLNGNRAISVERADHSRVFAERGRPGFVQHPYNFHGHDFARRTYFYHGRVYSHFYHGYAYRGVYLNVYAPGFYYRPAFYGWAYNPWAMPISYGWGWGGNPWFGYYGYYFQPYPVYPSAAYWLTDYIISSDLQTAYAAQQEAGEVDGAPPSAGGAPELTPDVKQQIADEVRNQLALENQEAQQNAQQQDIDPASSGIARMVSDGRPHVFVVGSALDVVDNSQTECSLSDGDVLALQTPPPADATVADVVVLASKGGPECQKQDTVSVALADLQEMQNNMRETIDQGLQDLQAKQGTGGLPALPPSAQSQPAPAQYAEIAPPPDPSAATEIQQQTQQADQAETEVSQGAGAPVSAAPVNAPPAAPAAPATVELGQTPDQVQAALGAPARVANLGSKVIYYYNGMKVTFVNGKVSDVQ